MAISWGHCTTLSPISRVYAGTVRLPLGHRITLLQPDLQAGAQSIGDNANDRDRGSRLDPVTRIGRSALGLYLGFGSYLAIKVLSGSQPRQSPGYTPPLAAIPLQCRRFGGSLLPPSGAHARHLPKDRQVVGWTGIA